MPENQLILLSDKVSRANVIYSISNEYGYGPHKLISCIKEKMLTHK